MEREVHLIVSVSVMNNCKSRNKKCVLKKTKRLAFLCLSQIVMTYHYRQTLEHFLLELQWISEGVHIYKHRLLPNMAEWLQK